MSCISHAQELAHHTLQQYQLFLLKNVLKNSKNMQFCSTGVEPTLPTYPNENTSLIVKQLNAIICNSDILTYTSIY